MSNTVGALYSRERPQTYRNWLRTTQPVAESTLRYWNAKRQCLQSRSNKEDDGVNWQELGNLSGMKALTYAMRLMPVFDLSSLHAPKIMCIILY